MTATIAEVDYHCPESRLTNEDLVKEFPDWTIDKINAKTGIQSRCIARPSECSSDLAVAAAQKLIARTGCDPQSIDFVLLCTQSPDYFLPTTACLVQERLGLPTTCGALDFNLGCSGYVYGLGLAKGLIETGQARRVLFLTAETYSKFIEHDDRSVRTIFGDAAAATLIEAGTGQEAIGPFVYGTDGSGAENLIVKSGGMRGQVAVEHATVSNGNGNGHGKKIKLYMNGPEIFTFTLQSVPQCVSRLLDVGKVRAEDIDLFVFHQANKFMLEHLRKKIGIPDDRFFVGMENIGNTVSASIPIALRQAEDAGKLTKGQLVALVGFGVGYSWGATLVRWKV
ncbi:MAG TPA: ketoacyl-ACP synthase III [Gemmataceae bacterium]|nr:ketoacyl-ACP synthase III [Gemmataceae bacterium]